MWGLRAHTRSEKEAVAGAECRVSLGEETGRVSCCRRGAGEAAQGQRLKSGSRLIDVSCRELFLPFGVKTWKLRRGARWRWAI